MDLKISHLLTPKGIYNHLMIYNPELSQLFCYRYSPLFETQPHTVVDSNKMKKLSIHQQGKRKNYTFSSTTVSTLPHVGQLVHFVPFLLPPQEYRPRPKQNNANTKNLFLISLNFECS